MNITFWGINYAPECTGIGIYSTQMCEYFREKGHELRVVTAFPYYPAWEKAPADRWVLYRTDDIEGVTVHRCAQYVPKQVRALTRMIHELSFVTSSFLRQLFLPAPDVYVVASPPLLLGVAVRVLCWIKRRPYVFRVLDLQPDAALGLGMVRQGLLTRFLYGCEAFAYRGAAKVCGICEGMLEAFRRKGVPEEKILFVPDWYHRSEFEPAPEKGRFRKGLDLPEDAVLAIYSGNMGVKQGLEILVEAAPYLEGSNVHILICGDGAQKLLLEEAIKQQGSQHIHLRPLVPREQYLEMLEDTDIALITQQAGSGAYFFPNKLIATLAAGNVVLSVADEKSELYKAMQTGNFGWNILPNQAEVLAKTLIEFSENREPIQLLIENGKRYIAAFDSAEVLPAFEQTLQALVDGRTKGNP